MALSVTVLGSTGSIGQNTLRVIANHPDRFQVFALTAQRSWELLLEQCSRFHPRYAVIADPTYFTLLRDAVKARGLSTTVLEGQEGLCMVAQHPDVNKVVAAIVGAAGLLPTLSAVQSGKQVLLANKEALVMSGELLMQAAKTAKAILLPIDSEHNALFQCLSNGNNITQYTLTASGGPFLTLPIEQMPFVTPEKACQHPNWAMGKKITVDCATLMNKGLELIEAAYFFGCSADQLDVLIHPQSIVHALVEYCDGSVLAQLASPDMRIPIAYCLGWPERIVSGAASLSLAEIGKLTFFAPDHAKFPCLSLAIEALKMKKAAPTVLNASNEKAVEAFLEGRIRLTDIPVVVESVLNTLHDAEASTIEAILIVDQRARQEAEKCLYTLSEQV